jgi:hypothetical protein
VAPGSDVMGAVRAAMRAWQELPTASIRFVEPTTTPTESTNLDDDLNLITMAPTAANAMIIGGANGTLALTRLSYSASTGRIFETDIVFNSNYPFSTNLAPDTFDLQAVLTHELGHVLGADHAPFVGDTMFFAVGRETFFTRNLTSDAAAFAAFAYGSLERPAGKGSISGSVTQSGRAVFGASVTAIELQHNRVFTALSESDGGYTIGGLPAGRYVVYAEPLDGPSTADTLTQGSNAYYRNLNTTFRTSFKEEVRIGFDGAGAAAASVDASFALADSAATANIRRLGRGDPNLLEGSVSGRAVVVSPGETLALLIDGPDTWKVASVDDVTILGDGITVDRSRGIRVLRASGGAESGFAVVIRVAPDAAPGPRSIRLRIGDQQVAGTGAVVVAERTLPTTKLYVPYLVASPEAYTGIALANPSDTPAAVRIKGHDANGTLIYEQDSIVPAGLSLPAGTQAARLERQVFNLRTDTRQSGSITIESDGPNVQGFFLAGDLDGNYLDGAEAITRPQRQLVFVDVLQNGLTATDIHLMNASDSAATVQLALVGASGSTLAGPVTRVIEARGKIGESVATLFSYAADLASAHVTASADQDVLAGFAYIRQSSTVFGCNAQPVDAAQSTLYSPQLVSGNHGVQFRTRLSLVNAGTAATPLTLTVMGDDGRVLAGPVSGGTLAAGGQLTLDAESFFGFTGSTQGAVKVVGSAGSKLLGSVLFGDGNPQSARLEFAAALPLAASGSTSFLFSQVAQAQGYYTGIALLAPEAADVRVDAFRADGSLAGSAQVALAAGTRRVSVLEALIPETRGQVQGYLKVTATRPVIGFVLFGATDGRFLSAVTPQQLR